MPSLYDAISVKGMMRYRMDKKFISADKVPENVREAITLDNIVDENGIVIVDQKVAEAKELSPEEQADLDKENTNTNPDATPDESADPTTETPNDKTSTPPPAPEVNTNEDEADDEELAAPAPKKAVSARAKPAARPEPKFLSKTPQSHPGMGFPRVNGKTVDIFDGVTPHTKLKLVGGHTVPLSEESFKTRSEAEIERKLKELGFNIVNLNNMEAAMADNLETDDDSDSDGLSDDSV